MRLIAKKPCSFGGRQFFIDDEIPVELVTDANLQEKYGVISIVETEGVSAVAELKGIDPKMYDGTVQIPVKGASDGENEQIIVVPATPEEIQQTFSIMQLNAEEGSKTIGYVKSENVLILLHAADSRKTIKEAAKKQIDNLSTGEDKNEVSNGNEPTGTNTEGADT